MSFDIIYNKAVWGDLDKVSQKDRLNIKSSINTKLVDNPELFGKPLRKSLKGYRSLRVGEYRIVFKIVSKNIKILAIFHRSDDYKKANKRITR